MMARARWVAQREWEVVARVNDIEVPEHIASFVSEEEAIEFCERLKRAIKSARG